MVSVPHPIATQLVGSVPLRPASETPPTFIKLNVASAPKVTTVVEGITLPVPASSVLPAPTTVAPL